MSISSGDFQEDKSLSPEDFAATPRSGVVLNNKTSSVQAAATIAMTGESPEKFADKKAEVSHPQTRPNVIEEQTKVKYDYWNSAKQELPSILADGSVPDDQKVRVLENTMKDTSFPGMKSTLEILAEGAAVAPTSPTADEREENAVDLAVRDVKEAVNFRRNMQSLVNDAKAGRDITVGSTIGDVAELMVPFAEYAHFARLEKTLTGDSNLQFLGEKKQKIFETLRGMPLSDRQAIAEQLIKTIQENDNLLMPDGNDLVAIQTLENMMLSNDYSTFERWFDNVFTVVDLAGLVGGTLKLAKLGKVKALGRAVEATDAEAEAISLAVRTDVGPASPARVVADVNGNSARAMHDLADADKTGAAAEGMYGTNRTEAIADDLLPTQAVGDEIPHYADLKPPRTGESTNARRLRTTEGNTILSDAEWEKVKTKITAGFQRAEGMYLHANSLAVRTLENGNISIAAKYHPVDGGFTTAKDAIEQARFALRTYGVRGQNVKLIARQPSGRWAPEAVKDAKARQALLDAGAPDTIKRQYGVVVDYNYSFRPEDLDEVELLTTGGGFISRALQFADRWPAEFSLARAGQGSFLQNLLDPASLIHPRIVNAASVAVDKSFRLRHVYVETFGKFTDGYKALSKKRRGLISDYIHQANFEAIPLEEADLIRRGFNAEERALLKEWRLANDTMWYAANQDLVVSLRARGWKILDHVDSNTSVVARQTKQAPAPKELVYDPVAKHNVAGNSDEVLEALNKETPSILVDLKEPIKIDGEWVSKMISRETPQGGYLRAIADDETVLAYREGYYPVMYDANYFITKRIPNGKGGTFTKAVATARTKDEADAFKARTMASENLTEEQYSVTYGVRQDKRSLEQKTQMLDEGSFNIAGNSNMSMQKVRGERLADAGVDGHLAGYTNLKDPLEAVAEQVRQVSKRIGMRKYLDTAKQRWMLQYGDNLDLPLDAYRKPAYPKSIVDVKMKAHGDAKLWQEAKSNFNYLYSLENGYINGIDKAITTSMHYAAEVIGDLGLPKWLEKSAHNLGGKSLTHSTKSVAFRLFLSSHPGRQALIQRMQLSQMAAYNAKYIANGGMAVDLWKIDRARWLISIGKENKADPEVLKLLQEIKDLGILQAVDAHTLIRDDYLRMADLTVAQKAGSVLRKPLDLSQKIGFDAAEQDVLVGSYLTFRDLAVRRGENLADIRVRERVLGEARAAALNMNRSGDVAHSHNTLAPITQFLSFQHKMLIQPFTNLNLTPLERGKLLALNTVMFGVPSTGLYLAYDKMFGSTEPSPTKDFLRDGLLDILVNSTLSGLSGEDVNISVSDLAPMEAYGMGNVVLHLAETPLSGLIAESPAGSLLFGNNPRLQNLFSTAMKAFVPMTDYEDPELQVGFVDVARAAAQTFSGYSSLFKANYAFNTGTAMSSSGRIADSDVNWMEALAMTFGLSTKDMKAQWNIYALKDKGSQRFYRDKDVEMWYQELKRTMARRGVHKPSEQAFARAALGEAWRVFGSDRPRAMKIIRAQISKDLKAGDQSIFTGLYKDMGLIEDGDWWRAVNQLPDTDKRQQLIEFKHRQEQGLKLLNEKLGE